MKQPYQKHIKKVLNKKILQLNDIIADIDMLLTEMETEWYRVCIFGSARTKRDTELYKLVYRLAFQLASNGIDIVTGGGPGLMEAANKGAKDGCQKSRSIGLPIHLPFESDANEHMDVSRRHRKFSSRLDEFMRISHAVVITPGGIGTLLELFYTWQLIQVDHIKPRPIILLGGDGMWPDLLKWLDNWTVANKLMSRDDFNLLVNLETAEDVVNYLKPNIEEFRKTASRPPEVTK
ncbi:MAG: LOG family protein [Bdellovibrionota bacterium]